MNPPQRTWRSAALGLVVLAAGLLALGVGVTHAQAWAQVFEELALLVTGWSGFASGLQGASNVTTFRHATSGAALFQGVELKWLAAGTLLSLVGFAQLAFAFARPVEPTPPPSEAVGAPLYPPLNKYRDFYWSTLLAYGGGILLSELAVMGLQTLLASSTKTGRIALAPVPAFGIALAVGSLIAFVAGFAGAARARRLAAPEATIGVVYLGMAIPAFLTVLPNFPRLELSVGLRLREVVYVANLIGRPELGYWLVFGLLVLMLVLGITSGFVANASGRTDLRTGFELFIAERHVSVFRPRLLLGGLAVLLFGIIPPLIIFAILRAAEAAVDRTRIRKLGLADPLRASAALHEARGKEQSPTAMMTALSVGGVGVGVMALIIVLSVMSGFEADLQEKILGTNAHAVVTRYADSIEDPDAVMEKIKDVRGVIGQTPFVMNEVMLSSDQNVAGVIIEGVDPKTVGSVTDLPKNVLPGGSIEGLVHPESIDTRHLSDLGVPDERPATSSPTENSPPQSPANAKKKSAAREDDDVLQAQKPTAANSGPVLPGILLGREVAGVLRVGVGEHVNVVSPFGGELGPNGPTPKIKAFRVAGIFYSGMYEYDSKYVYIRLGEAEKFFDTKGASGIALKVNDVDDARRISNAVSQKLDGYPYRVRDWGEMNKNLFSALRLEKLVMGIILSIIVIVAAGLIVATVIMLVLEKRKEISVLKALGVPDGGIVKIFLAEGLQIGIAGGLLGLLSGLAWCVFIEKVGIKLDPEVYYIPSLPVKIEPLQTALSVVIAILVTYLASVYPALKASRVEPVEGLKAE